MIRTLLATAALTATVLAPAASAAPSDEVFRRLAGDGRITTGIEISKATFPAAETVVIANAFGYPDALAGATLAAQHGAPMLLTGGDRLDERVATEIRRLGATRAYLLGGTTALSEQVEADVEALGVTVERLGGQGRFETAGLVALEVAEGGTVGHVYVVEGSNVDPGRGWPDAVSVAGLAAMRGSPILLVTRDALPPATRETIRALPDVTTATIVGGEAAVSENVRAAVEDEVGRADRISGENRYDTSNRVAQAARTFGGDPLQTWFATGLAFPDALAAGPAVAANGGILHLVHGLDLSQSPHAAAWTNEFACEFTRVTLTGGESAISPQVDAELRGIVDRKCGPPDVNIVDVVEDPDGADDAFDGGEYLTVRNDGGGDVFLKGWYVLDDADTRLPWCDIGLVPGATARLYSGQGNDGPDHCHAGSNRSVFNNEGDTLRLYDPDNNLVDTLTY